MSLFQKLASQDVKMRFAVSLIGNFLRLFLSFLTTLYLARSMGPAKFGDFHFLMNSFQGVRALLDLGVQVAFFTFISQKKREARFFYHYLGWVFLQLLVVVLFVFFVCPPNLLDTIWLGMDRKVILLSFLASFAMNQCWEVSTNIGESVRETFGIQIRNLITATGYLFMVFFLHSTGQLYLPQVYLGIFTLYILMAILHVLSLKKSFLAEPDSTFSYIKLSKEYMTYCLPLAVSFVVSSFQSFLENWMLQRFGGSIHQGFFMLGNRFSTICLLATTAILKIFWKEVAEAFAKDNPEHIQKVLKSTFRLLFSSSAVLSGYLVPFAPFLLLHFVGNQYEKAWPVLCILFIYPVHQGLGQVITTFFQATNRTRLYRNLTLFNMVLSVTVTYLLLAPRDALISGLGLGSTGMALKMICINVFSVNLGLFFVKKHTGQGLSIPFQILVLGFFLSSGYLSHLGLASFFPEAGQKITSLISWMALSGIIYGVICLVAGFLSPGSFGVNERIRKLILSRLGR